MSTIFIAVQCCQCSTMQVKQRKKSSNKWSCVICNQKQSTQMVFAQGFIARDVRKFVQGFNMSRKFTEENAKDETLIPPPLPPQEEIHNRTKRRSDWEEYLDPEDLVDDKQTEQATGGVPEPRIVTELPKEMFKKPKLKNYSARLDTGAGANGLLKPNFSNRKRATNPVVPQKDKEEVKELQPGRAKGGTTSKWSNFLAEEDEYELVTKRGIREDPDPWRQPDILDNPFSDQRVEEEIHPDF